MGVKGWGRGDKVYQTNGLTEMSHGVTLEMVSKFFLVKIVENDKFSRKFPN